MTPNNGIPYVTEGTLDPAAGLNLALNVIDALLQTAVISMSLTAPPGSPDDGDLYIPAGIVPGPSTGLWAGLEGKLVRYVADGAFWQSYDASIVINLDDGGLYKNIPGSPGGWTLAAGLSDAPIDGLQYVRRNGAWEEVAEPVVIQIAASDLTTDLSAGTAKAYVRAPCAFTVTQVRASLLDASTSGAVTIDINEAGVSILSTKLTIDQGEKTSVTAATPPVISDASIADDAEITIDIDAAGVDAQGLIVTIRGVRAP
jgi:hypothetical protein